jgi:membrane protease subunit (stomatin/prohibitin family)
MRAIDLVEWREPDPRQKSDPNPNSPPVFAWRYPQTNLSTFTQLIVRESQEAVLFSKGQTMGKFGPGKHTLKTENLPGLRTLFGLPFGGDNPFTAEVWFVNKVLPLNIDWQTDPMMHHDPDYQTMLPLVAKGRYGLRVEEAERFLLQLVGTASLFTAENLTSHFQGELVSKTKSAILQFMLAQRIGIKTVNACLVALSDVLRAAMAPFWKEFGFALAGFYITSIEVDGQSPAGSRILDAMSRQSAQVIAGYSYQQDRALEIAGEAARGGSGLMAAVMMNSLMGGSPGLLQGPAGPLPGTLTPAASGTVPTPQMRMVFCSNCARKFSADMKFCPHCGDPYTPCPRCATDNDSHATRCVSCGTPLSLPAPAGEGCSRCGGAMSASQAFCPNCGQRAAR